MKIHPISLPGIIAISILLIATEKISAHCDTLDGPVVQDARLALEKGDVTPSLKWVNKDGEAEVRAAFADTLKVRSFGEEARKLADEHFLETLVRVHRAGEGMPFTGLKPQGTTAPAFVAADKALVEGSISKLSDEIFESARMELHKRFKNVLEKKNHADESVEAGRAYVAAYVQYAHFIETLHSLGSHDAEEPHRMGCCDDGHIE